MISSHRYASALNQLIASFAADPIAVFVDCVSENPIRIKANVGPGDHRKVVGKNGARIIAINSAFRILGEMNGQVVFVELARSPESENDSKPIAPATGSWPSYETLMALDSIFKLTGTRCNLFVTEVRGSPVITLQLPSQTPPKTEETIRRIVTLLEPVIFAIGRKTGHDLYLEIR